MTKLKGKVAIVTGASRGIGRCIALKLAEEGCDVAFNYLSSKDDAQSLEEEIQQNDVRAQSHCVDIKDFTAVKKWVDDVKNEYGGIDILINNAGITVDRSLMMMSEEDWKSVLDTNLNGMFNAARAVIVTFMKQKGGQIINISSVSGIIGLSGQTNYSASKGGMNAFTKALAKEVAAHGVRVNAVAPGYIETEMLRDFSEEQKSDLIKSIPMERIGQQEDVANAVSFLLSEDAKYITGQVLQIDGGLAMR